MNQFFINLLSDGSTVSSARFLNIIGAAILGGVYIADFILRGSINLDATETLALYFGGVYGLSKGFTSIKSKLGTSVERKNDDS